ncbi:hypothetical protein BT67DRAFT_457147 [Trichocladium antarcticum]|uniref:DUF3752 domain-containing protein n=1 Tax=Trichocladium antarcticum TaxID=1450529 RepID=A0AAN6ZC48_9PEZI|nr:hypothetical protein BT67DRAFT_457147 [Trichocladium antarcticum]
MSSIGPQLPPHLQKRKRTPDDPELGSPPPKNSRRDNEDEIALDDDSDDGFGPSGPHSVTTSRSGNAPPGPKPSIGPSLPPPVAKNIARAPANQRRPVGPSLPPSAARTNGDEIPVDDDSDADTTGPAPRRPKAGPAPPPKRVLGPAPPPADLSQRPTTSPDSDSDSSDDDWGPALPGAAGGPKSAAARHPAFGAQEPQTTAPKRDDWMLAPPSSSSGPRAPDPTKLKSRKFASGPRAAAADGRPAGVSSIWTETPDEKIRRLANAVLGRDDPNAVPPAATAGGTRRPDASSKHTPEDAARIRSYVEQTRGKSMVEQHQAAKLANKAERDQGKERREKWGSKHDEDEDDPSKRAFDWEKDMKVGGNISGAQRKELLNKAANLGGRFQTGKYL